jgi:hypothetical protein
LGTKLLTSDVKISPSGFCFYLSTKKEAIALIDTEFNDLAKIAHTGGFEATTVYYPRCKKPVKVYATHYKEMIEMPQSLMIKDAELPFELQRFVFDMGSSDTPQGLVKVGNSKQILLTENNKIVTPNCGTLLGATRDRYWNAEDLERFDREWRRSLRDDCSNFFEFHYSIHDLDQPGVNLQQKHNRYRLVLDLRGNPYHICESLN